MATSFSGGRSQSARRETLTMGKQLVNFITCGCESSAPFLCNLQIQTRTHAVLVIGLYELLGNPGADPIRKNMIFWRKIVIFYTKHPKNVRASLTSAQFFLSAPP